MAKKTTSAAPSTALARRTQHGADVTPARPAATPQETTTLPRSSPESVALVPAVVGNTGLMVAPATAAWPEHAASILTEPVEEQDIDILPTGEVYYSQIQYRRRLVAAFGPGNWRMVSEGEPIRQGDSLIQKWWLYVYGQPHAETLGEAEYQEDNERMTWATAWEAAKSNALMRLCKDLGIASECWDRRWANAWRAANAVQVFRSSKKKPEWRRIDADPFWDETGPTDDSPNPEYAKNGRHRAGPANAAPPVPPPVAPRPSSRASAPAAGPGPGGGRTISEAQEKRLYAILASRAKGLDVPRDDVEAAARAHCAELTGSEHFSDLTREPYEAVVAFIERWTPAPRAAAPFKGERHTAPAPAAVPKPDRRQPEPEPEPEPEPADETDPAEVASAAGADEAWPDHTYYVAGIGDPETGKSARGTRVTRWKVDLLGPLPDAQDPWTGVVYAQAIVDILEQAGSQQVPVVLTCEKKEHKGEPYLDVTAARLLE